MSEANMRLGLSASLRSLVYHRFNQARASQSLIFSDTQLVVLHSKAGIPFHVRYCPALSKKPTDNKPSAPKQESSTPKKKFDPFENPSADLLVARIPDSTNHTHNLVLNKFPVIHNHVILATRINKPQTNLLEEADLCLAYACLEAWNDDQQHKLYAFFNSGEYSGASQSHRHLQFLPVEDMMGSASMTQWDLLCDRMTTSIHPDLPLLQDIALPIIHLATPLSTSMTPSQLHDKYLLLLRATSILLASREKSFKPLSELLQPSAFASAIVATDTGRTTFSYNLALTVNTMAILPRRAEDAMIPGLTVSDSGTGTVSINGTILAGTLMVKNEDEWNVLNTRPDLLTEMFRQVGFPKAEVSRI